MNNQFSGYGCIFRGLAASKAHFYNLTAFVIISRSHQWVLMSKDADRNMALKTQSPSRMMLHADMVWRSNFTVSGADKRPSCMEATVTPATSCPQSPDLRQVGQRSTHRTPLSGWYVWLVALLLCNKHEHWPRILKILALTRYSRHSVNHDHFKYLNLRFVFIYIYDIPFAVFHD